MPAARKLTAEQRGIVHGYRSGFEDRVHASMRARGVEADYETLTLPYEVPARIAKYSPDFPLPNGIVVETKGRWVTEDRKKIKLIVERYPDLDLRMVFQRSSTRISKTSTTTYAAICQKLGILYADKDVPDEWLNEPPNEASLAIIRRLSRR